MKQKQHDRDYIISVDRQVMEITKTITVLSLLNWPDHVQKEFFSSLDKKNPKVPDFTFPKRDESDKINALKKLIRCIGESHPALLFLKRTAESYLEALHMLEAVGTPKFTEHSINLYGQPEDALPLFPDTNNVHAAEFFLDNANSFNSDMCGDIWQTQMNSESLKQLLEERMRAVFSPGEITVEIDPNRVSRVGAIADKVLIRSNTWFSQFDAEQLLNHEVYTHSLTTLNGRKQPYLTCLGYSSPRIIVTQEGLATFSELITGWLDLNRLKRIALRILAIDMALKGADFIELFRFFESHGQNRDESYFSAMRIMRGGRPEGGVVFTKDNVYLRGMLEVHSFFLENFQENTLDKLEILFAGKLTTGDVEELYPLMQEGLIAKPRYLPDWFRMSHGLAAQLAFNAFITNIELSGLNIGNNGRKPKNAA